jgi:hypothetical protein
MNALVLTAFVGQLSLSGSLKLSGMLFASQFLPPHSAMEFTTVLSCLQLMSSIFRM